MTEILAIGGYLTLMLWCLTLQHRIEINYAGGLYDDPAANYYLDVSPIMHFDANFINGVDSSGNPAQGQPVVTWNDRSQSSLGIDLTQPEAVKQGDYDNSQGTAEFKIKPPASMS